MLNKIKKDKMFAISIFAILFIPVLYAANFLFAFADPYNNLNNVPVAIVNDDHGYNEKNIGNDFISSLKESNNFKWYFVTDEEALKGMKDNKYYFTVKIPDEFSESVYSTLSGTSKEANLIYMANDNKNYICGVLGNALVNELENSLNKNIISNFVLELDGKVSSGVSNVESAAYQLVNGSSILTTSLDSLNKGTSDLKDSVSKLKDGYSTIENGTTTLSNNYKVFNQSLTGASNSLSTLYSNYYNIELAMNQYKSSLEQALSISSLPDSVKNSLIANYSTIYQNTNILNSNLSTLNSGVKTLSDKSNEVESGIESINKGSIEFNTYLESLYSGVSKLNESTNLIYNGSYSLNNGLNQLSSGVSSFTKTLKDLNLSNNASNVASPVVRKDEAYSSVDNYGYGFAPYFISLGLFVGALITTIVLEMREDKKNINKVNVFKKIGLFASIVSIQAIILDIVLLLTKIKIDNILLFIIFTLLIALTFMAIVQMLTTTMGNVGRFIAIVLLTLQLTSCGGTFPIETAPKFYNIISPLMPMTYTVDGLRVIIGNGNNAILLKSVIILISIIIVCYLVIYLYFKKSKKDILN